MRTSDLLLILGIGYVIVYHPEIIDQLLGSVGAGAGPAAPSQQQQLPDLGGAGADAGADAGAGAEDTGGADGGAADPAEGTAADAAEDAAAGGAGADTGAEDTGAADESAAAYAYYQSQRNPRWKRTYDYNYFEERGITVA